jgi:leucyl-tRNA synthetase
VSPLATIPEFVNTSCPQCGGPARRETDVSDNFLDSAWYYLRYTSTEYGDRPWDAERVRRWLPVDHYAGGPEHTTMHHLYARFLAHALHDLGHLPFREPFRRLRLHGTITRDGAKMSKSRGNVISPDSYIAEYGADVFRMYMLFLGPWQEGGDWSNSGLTGVARFVSRVWNMIEDARESFATTHDASNVTHESSAMTHDAAAERRRHHLIARVTDGIETLRFHVAIAALMEDLNWLRESWSGIAGEQRARSIRTLVLLLAPFAPHLAEEWWERIGGTYSVHGQPWPEHDSQQLQSAVIELPVQINGKLRDRITVAADADDAAVTHAALSSERVLAALGGESPRRVIVVPSKVVNIVR